MTLKGREAHRLGLSNEQAVLCCLEFKNNIAPWISDTRKATKEEDSNGIDIVLITEYGDVPIQVKSSIKRKKDFVKKHPDIPVVCVYPNDSEINIRGRVKSTAMNWLRTKGIIINAKRSK